MERALVPTIPTVPAVPAWSRRDLWVSLLLGAATVVYLLPLLHLLRPGLEDEGDFVMLALSILQGKAPYVDLFIHVTPGGGYVLAGWMAVFGDRLEVVRSFLLLVAAAMTMLLHRTARHVLPPLPAALAAVAFALTAVPRWPIMSYYWAAIPFVLASALLLVEVLERESPLRIVMLGACAGASVASLQSIGCAVLGACVLILCWPRRLGGVVESAGAVRRAGWLAVGVVIPLLPLTLALAARGAVAATLDATLFYTTSTLRQFNECPFTFFPWGTVTEGLRGLAQAPPEVLWAHAGAVLDFLSWPPLYLLSHGLFFPSTLLFLGLAWRDARRGHPLGSGLLGLALFQAAVATTILYRPDEAHITFIRLAWWILVVHYGIWRPLASCRPWTRAGLVTAWSLVLACLLLQAGFRYREMADAPYEVRLPRGTVRMAQREYASGIQSIQDQLQILTRPGDPIFVYPVFPMLYYLSDRESATRYMRMVPFLNRADHFDEVRQVAARGRMQAVVLLPVDYPTYLALYPHVDGPSFVAADRGFQQVLEAAAPGRIVRATPR